MNYIKQIQGFHNFNRTVMLSSGQISLWYALMYINNSCFWAEWFTAPNKVLELESGLSRSGVQKNREVLRERGLIEFRARGTFATGYKIKMLYQESNQESNQERNQERSGASRRERGQDSGQNSGALININQTKYKNTPPQNEKKKAFKVAEEYADLQHDIYDIERKLLQNNGLEEFLQNAI